MISVTEKASEEIQRLIKDSEYTKPFIKVSVKGGGCSGLMYNLEFVEEQTNENLYEDKGVKILVDKKSLLYLAGTELNFSDGLNGKGFQFINPNASRTCGCGESFSL